MNLNELLAPQKEMPLMDCGHIAQASDRKGKPVCVMCIGKKEGATVVSEVTDLSQRKSRCTHCGEISHTDTELPGFRHRQEREFDDYYCGCRGWS